MNVFLFVLISILVISHVASLPRKSLPFLRSATVTAPRLSSPPLLHQTSPKLFPKIKTKLFMLRNTVGFAKNLASIITPWFGVFANFNSVGDAFVNSTTLTSGDVYNYVTRTMATKKELESVKLALEAGQQDILTRLSNLEARLSNLEANQQVIIDLLKAQLTKKKYRIVH